MGRIASRGGVVAAGLGLALGGCGGAGAPRGEPPTANVLLITLDTLRADRLGCYGYRKDTSPTLDRLAAQSAVFDLAIAQAAVTPVSHASILTGLDPYHHGLRVLHGLVGNRLADGHRTLAEVWRDAGGRTAAFVSAYPVSAAFGLDQGFEVFDASFAGADGAGVVASDGMVATGAGQRRADETTRAAVAWLERHRADATPFLMWVHYFDPHDDLLVPPAEVIARFAAGAGAAAEERARAIYDADVFFMDHEIGRLLRAFEERGLADRTIVAVVADHGEGLGDHDWWSHGILYQEQIRVPLMIRLPDGPPPRRIAPLVRTIDLMPTLLEAAGVDPALWPSMDGASLAALIAGVEDEEARLAYADSVNLVVYGRPGGMRSDRKTDKLYCLMDRRHKLIVHQLEPEATEFYDLATDPTERNNLAAARPPRMAELKQRLDRLDPYSAILPRMTPTDLERAERLRQLGYVE